MKLKAASKICVSVAETTRNSRRGSVPALLLLGDDERRLPHEERQPDRDREEDEEGHETVEEPVVPGRHPRDEGDAQIWPTRRASPGGWPPDVG